MAKKKTDLTKVTYEPHTLPCPLSEKEKAEAADQLATAIQSAESLELERKAAMGDFRSRLEALKERIHNLTRQVKEGVESRSVKCELRLNYTKLTAILIRTDTKETVEERPLTDEEKQMKFDLDK